MFSFVGDTVLDPFGESGSTAVAVSRVGRNSINIEIEPQYVDVIEERLENERATLSNYESMEVELHK